MASPSLSSLLGLASPSPVIAPSAVERRLSKTELRVATTAFHRARGYSERIDFPRFRDTVLQEAFHAMPLYIMQRLFMVFNYVDSAAGGALTLKEFLVGIAIVWKGTREEHLKFAFQLMDRSGIQELSKRDAMAFLRAVARADGVVAVEEPSGRSYTAEEFATAVLFAGDNAVLTPSKFLKLMTARSFKYLALVNWMSKLAMQFENEKNTFRAAITPLAKPNESKNDQLEAMVASIRVKLRRLSSDGIPVSTTSSASAWSPASPVQPATQPVEDDRQCEFSVIQIETLTADQFYALKMAFSAMTESVLCSRELLTDVDLRQRLEGLVPATLVESVIHTAKMCAGDFIFANPNGPHTDTEAALWRSKVRLFWWMVCLCCSMARSSAEVWRYLFVLVDTESRGYWTMDQLSTFIQLVDFHNEEQSSHDEAAFLAQTVFDEVDSMKQQLHTRGFDSEPTEIVSADEAMVFRFRDFDQYLSRYPIAGCSLAEVDSIFTLFHVNLARHRGPQLTHRSFLDALSGFCGQLLTYKVLTQHGFCLLPRLSWDQIVDWICNYDSDSPLLATLKLQVCTAIHVPDTVDDLDGNSAINCVVSDDPTSSLVAIPLSLWLVIAMRLRGQQQPCQSQSASTQPSWTTSASRLVFTTANGNDGPHRGSWEFQGLVASLDLTVAARDGSECRITMPHCVIDEQISLQVVVQTALALHGSERASTMNGVATSMATHPHGAIYCEGEAVFSGDNGSGRVQVSQATTLVPLTALDKRAESHRVAIKMHVLLTDDRSNSSIPRWPAHAMVSSPASSYRSNASSPSSPTPRQKRNAAVGWTKVHGLANLGNTCFMNSALQCLAATPLLREYFLKGEHLFDLFTHTIPLKETKGKSDKALDTVLPKSSLVPVALGQLLAEMNAYSSNGSVSGMADVIAPKHMKTAVATLFPHLSDGSQQDAQEFLSSLLSSLSEELKRLPVATTSSNHTASCTLTSSPPSLLSRFINKHDQAATTSSPPLASASHSVSTALQLQVSDSEGRPDQFVAEEWWLSHVVAEPSIVTALFCGQFKSTLCCSNCGYTSARFEPFSSLQLPLIDETAMLSPRTRPQYQHVAVVLHFVDSPCKSPSLRLVVQAGLEWTVEQLIIKIQQDHATFSSTDTRRDHIAVALNGFVVDDYIDPDALLSTVAAPLNVFEVEFGDQARAFGRETGLTGGFEAGDKVLARASYDRWVKGVVERQAETHASRANSPARSLASTTYDIRMIEANCGTSVCLTRLDIRPFTSERLLLLRFVHRRPGLVPFYSTSPYRQVLCGFPFVYRMAASLLTGRGLYHLVHDKFCAHAMTSRRPFVLKHVRSDGKCCIRCHWSDQCDGCKIDRLDEEPLELEMDETIAIDWMLDAHEPVEDWIWSGYCIEDHTSYVAFKLDSTHSLEKSLDMLCSSEQVDARCSHCPRGTDTAADEPASSAMMAHTKTLALWSLPPILVIQLKRFELVADRGYTYQRLNHSVDFPVDHLYIAKFLAACDSSSSSNGHSKRQDVMRAAAFLANELQFPTATTSRTVSSYRLYGVVNHMGDLSGGHYTAHIRHPDNADWWLVDDASATPANPQTLSPSTSAYLLFYVRDDLDPTPSDAQEESGGPLRPTVSEFYPRQTHATRVNDAAIHALWKQDVWQRATARISELGRLSPSKASATHDDGNCTLM